MLASFVLDLEKSFHFYVEPKWENDIKSYAKYPFWIGNNDPKWNVHHDHLLTIPNFYEFKHNKDVVDNNKVGFAARMETRKCPHFLQGIDCEVFTEPTDIKWWERNLNLWDISAGTLLIIEAGGKISGFNNDIWDVDKKDIIASNNLIHNKLVEKLSLL